MVSGQAPDTGSSFHAQAFLLCRLALHPGTGSGRGLRTVLLCPMKKLFFLLGGLLAFAGGLRAQTLNFKPLDGYFYRNDAPSVLGVATLLIFRSQAEFEARVHPAATMGRPLEQPDFSKEIVVGLVMPPTDHPTELAIKRVKKKYDDLIVYYHRKLDRRQVLSYSSQPLVLVRVPGTRWKGIFARQQSGNRR